MQSSRITRQQRRAAERRSRKATSRVSIGRTSTAAFGLGLGLCVGQAGTASAANFVVTNNADDGVGSLRRAVDDANANVGVLDTITFAGVSGTITLLTGDIDITEGVTITGPGSGTLTVNGNSSERIFDLNCTAAPRAVSISRLTITNGDDINGGAIRDEDCSLTLDQTVITGSESGDDGGALWIDGTNAALTIRNSRITGNTSYDDGAGIYGAHPGGTITIEDTTIATNTATDGSGGGIYLHGPLGDVTIVDSQITGNRAEAGSGGGLYLGTLYSGATLTIRDTNISDNYSDFDGGGIYLQDADGIVNIESSTISSNTSDEDAGGISIENNCEGDINITDSIISMNRAYYSGGGIYIEEETSSNVTIIDSVISQNSTYDGDGGGIYADQMSGLLTITRCTISGNHSDDDGGGIYLDDPEGGVNITDSTISGNSADDDGGGIYFYDPDNESVVIQNSTISGNTAGDDGGGVYLYEADSGDVATALRILNTTIADNIADDEGGGLGADDDGSNDAVEIRNSILADNTASTGADLFTDLDTNIDVAFSLIEAPIDGSINDNGGNIFGQDPNLSSLGVFGGPTQTQPLMSGSPALDAGDPGFTPPPAFDQRGGGFVRVLNGRIDMGAVEGLTSNIAPAPALGGLWSMFGASVLAGIGYLGLRRRRNDIASALALGCLIAASDAEAGERQSAEISQIEAVGGTVKVHLEGGAIVEVRDTKFQLKDLRSPATVNPDQELGTIGDIDGQPAVLEIKRNDAGDIRKVRVKIFDTLEEAQSAAAKKD